MARIVGQSPYGVAVEQDDGTVLTMPPGYQPAPLAPPLDPQPASPVPGDPFFASPDAPIAPPSTAAEIDMDPSMPGDTPGVDPTTSALAGWAPPPSGLADPFATPAPMPGAIDESLIEMEPNAAASAPLPDVAPVPDAITGVAPIAAPAPAVNLADPSQGGNVASEPFVSPEDQAVDAIRAQGVVAKQIADEQSRLNAERDAKLAEHDRLRAEADAKIAEHLAQVEIQADVARQNFINYDLTPEEKTSPMAIIALLIGGLGNVLTRNYGAANPVIAILERKAADAAKARVTQQNKLGQAADMTRGKVDSINAQIKSTAAAELNYKSALLESYARQAESMRDSFAGAQIDAGVEQSIAAVRAASMSAAQKAAIEQQKEQREEAKLVLEAQKAIDQREHQLRSDKTAQQAVGVQARSQRAQERQWGDKFKADEGERAARLKLDQADLDQRIKEAEAAGNKPEAAMLRHRKEIADDVAGRAVQQRVVAKVVTNPDGSITSTNEVQELMNAPGPMADEYGRPIFDEKGEQKIGPQQFLAPTIREGEELRKKYAVTKTYTDIVDQLNAAIAKHGWSSETLRSDEWLRAQSLWADGALLRKGPEMDQLGVLNGADIDIIAKAMGTKDPTQFLDPSAGLRQSRDTAVAKYNTALVGARYTGSPVEFPDATTLPGGVASEAAQAATAATTTPTNWKGEDAGSHADATAWGGIKRERDRVHGRTRLNQAQAYGVDALINLAKDRDPARRADALAKLKVVAAEPSIADNVIDALAAGGIDMSSVDEALAKKVRAVSSWNSYTGSAEESVRRDLGLGGAIGRDFKRAGVK